MSLRSSGLKRLRQSYRKRNRQPLTVHAARLKR
jgi:hypothetical protein